MTSNYINRLDGIKMCQTDRYFVEDDKRVRDWIFETLPSRPKHIETVYIPFMDGRDFIIREITINRKGEDGRWQGITRIEPSGRRVTWEFKHGGYYCNDFFHENQHMWRDGWVCPVFFDSLPDDYHGLNIKELGGQICQLDTLMYSAEVNDDVVRGKITLKRIKEALGVNKSELQLMKKYRITDREYDYIKAHQLSINKLNLKRVKAMRLNEPVVHRTVTVKHTDEEREEIARQHKDFFDSMKPNFKSKRFTIVMPTTFKEFQIEGTTLNHCVARLNYFERHCEGKQMIFFVRKNEELSTPFFTMELDIETGKILQLYGFQDCSAPQDVRAFAEAFANNYCNKQEKERVA